VLDEATSSADPQTDHAIRQMLAAQDKTILMVSHRPESAAHADTVLTLDQGRITQVRQRPAHRKELRSP